MATLPDLPRVYADFNGLYDLDATEHRDPDKLYGVGVVTWNPHWGWATLASTERAEERCHIRGEQVRRL